MVTIKEIQKKKKNQETYVQAQLGKVQSVKVAPRNRCVN